MSGGAETATTAPAAGISTGGRPRTAAPWLVVVGLLLLSVILLRVEGRIWWCECGQVRPWISDVWTPHCSQHLFDPYSLTHVGHGLIFGWILLWLAPRWSVAWQMVVVVALAGGWEVLENSPLIIDRYRTATMSLDYLGDSVVNSMGDILSCILGYLLVRWMGFRWSLLLFVAMELFLLWFIRDNLTLGVIMLIRPIEAIKTWQMGGQQQAAMTLDWLATWLTATLR